MITHARVVGLADLVAELDDLENHAGQDVDALRARADDAARAADRAGDEVLGHRARLVQADMRQRSGEAGPAAQVFLAVHRWAEQHDCRPLRARTHYHLALTHHYLGDQAAGLEHALGAVELLDDTAPAGLRILALLRLANSLAESGSAGPARDRYRQAERLAVEAGDAARRMTVLNNLAYLELEEGELDVAGAVVDRMYAAAAALGRDLLIVERDTVANVRIGQGRHAEAEATLQSIHDAPPWFEAHDAADAELTLAMCQRHLGAHDRAQASLDRCLRLCDRHQLAGVRVRALAEQAELHAATGDYQRAFETYKTFHAAGEELRNAQQEARARTRQAILETAEARRDAERYREQARRDPLTGLFNRRFVDEQLRQVLADASAAGTTVTVALLDLDHFKRINDTLSHHVGDQVLVTVAELLAGDPQLIAAGGFVARMGGEEFLAVRPGNPDWLDGVRRRIRGHDWTPITGDLPVTVSIGAVHASGGDPDDLIAEADRRLYSAKHGGRDQVVAA